jgi:diguanylate cyclase (GGDEF)-like protein
LLRELAGDISFALEHIEKSEKIDYLAYYDQLTGLPNRALFNERVTHQLNAAESNGGRAGIVLLDVDRFRAVNDSLGRLAGDDLIKQMAARLVHFVGNPASLARTGSNQFAILLPAIDDAQEGANFVVRLFKACFDQPYRLDGAVELRIAVKAGIALSPEDGADAEVLQRNAEAALKKAKTSGERYLFYAPHMNEKVAEKLSLESQLRAALEQDQFVLHYQPKIDLKTGAVAGVEALIRWQSPELGLVQPLRFIPILEETGLMLDVGAWVVRRAALDHREWTAAGIPAPRVAVNVSAVQLRRQDFVQTLRDALAPDPVASGVDIELTESLLMEDIEQNVKKLEAAREMGIRIAVDDFGTGYSSLRYLAMLPAHTLKIDRSFIITMLADPNVMTLVSTVISMAHSLGLEVVAEGVDQMEQAIALRELGCDQFQGYLVSRPVAKDALLALLRQRETGQGVLAAAAAATAPQRSTRR